MLLRLKLHDNSLLQPVHTLDDMEWGVGNNRLLTIALGRQHDPPQPPLARVSLGCFKPYHTLHSVLVGGWGKFRLGRFTLGCRLGDLHVSIMCRSPTHG